MIAERERERGWEREKDKELENELGKRKARMID